MTIPAMKDARTKLDLKRLLERVLEGENLTLEEARLALHGLAEPEENDVLKAGFLVALRAKGESANELRGFVRGMLELGKGPLPSRPATLVDTCGTGGDGSNSFNISSAAAILSAALGVPVAKHGNRSVSSRCGSADLFEALGLRFAETPEDATKRLEKIGFAFLFAPTFHPAAAAVAPARKALGVRTIFNILGPLVNPARPSHQLIGAYEPDVARRMAEALAGLGVTRAFCIHGEPGWDEATPAGQFLCVQVQGSKIDEGVLDPNDFGIERCRPEDLAGGDAKENVELFRRILDGEKGPLFDAVALNAALVLLLTGRESDPRAAYRVASAPLEDGRAKAYLDRLRGHDE